METVKRLQMDALAHMPVMIDFLPRPEVDRSPALKLTYRGDPRCVARDVGDKFACVGDFPQSQNECVAFKLSHTPKVVARPKRLEILTGMGVVARQDPNRWEGVMIKRTVWSWQHESSWPQRDAASKPRLVSEILAIVSVDRIDVPWLEQPFRRDEVTRPPTHTTPPKFNWTVGIARF